jgi:hypothetical protein
VALHGAAEFQRTREQGTFALYLITGVAWFIGSPWQSDLLPAWGLKFQKIEKRPPDLSGGLSI